MEAQIKEQIFESKIHYVGFVVRRPPLVTVSICAGTERQVNECLKQFYPQHVEDILENVKDGYYMTGEKLDIQTFKMFLLNWRKRANDDSVKDTITIIMKSWIHGPARMWIEREMKRHGLSVAFTYLEIPYF